MYSVAGCSRGDLSNRMGDIELNGNKQSRSNTSKTTTIMKEKKEEEKEGLWCGEGIWELGN